MGQITDLTSGPARPLTSKDISEAIKRLEKLNIADAKKRATEAAKNNLEAYIYATKDKVAAWSIYFYFTSSFVLKMLII